MLWLTEGVYDEDGEDSDEGGGGEYDEGAEEAEEDGDGDGDDSADCPKSDFKFESDMGKRNKRVKRN